MSNATRFLPLLGLTGLLSTTSALAQNDECTTAAVLLLGSTPFDTAQATLSAEPWPCASNGGPDLWYEYTAPNTNAIRFETCGASYDTALEGFSGTCGALTSIVCNDDACSTQSSIVLTPNAAGDVFYVRIGGFGGASGAGNLTVNEIAGQGNDECTTASPILDGVLTPFDTSVASLSTLPWNCGSGGAPDLWYSYVPVNSNVLLHVETCGSSYDTAIEVYEGTCAAPILIACNDDACTLQSQITATNVMAGQTYWIRVGGWQNSVGSGTLLVEEGPPPVQGCVVDPGFETGDLTGWTFVNAPDAFPPGSATLGGSDLGQGLFVSAPTEGIYSFTHGFDANGPGTITLSQQVDVTGVLTPMTYDYRAGWDMLTSSNSTLDRTFNVVIRDPGSGNALQTTTVLTAMAGTSTQDTGSLVGVIDLSMYIGQSVVVSFEWFIPESFTGAGHFELDNISCPAGAVIGTNYCGPAPTNSSGGSGVMSATGSAVASANLMTLVASQLPTNSFGFFLASTTQGFVGNPGGSQGNLCVGGSIGRYVGPGQIQNAGQAQQISLLLDLTMTPQPTGFVSVGAGEVWNFQAWFRDAVGGMATSNFTDGLEVTFL